MGSTSLQVMGLLLAIAGWAFGILVCAAPWWRVSAFVGDELVVSQVLWEGLWMTCLSQWGRLQCKVYDSGLALSSSAQMCRGLCVLSLLLCLLAVPLSVAGLKCTRCLGDAHESKARMVRVGAALFLLAAFFFLVPVCWTAYVVIRDFYDPNVAAPLKRELGPALYLGWGVTVLMLVGGAVLYLGSASPELQPCLFLEEEEKRTLPQRQRANRRKFSCKRSTLSWINCVLLVALKFRIVVIYCRVIHKLYAVIVYCGTLCSSFDLTF